MSRARQNAANSSHQILRLLWHDFAWCRRRCRFVFTVVSMLLGGQIFFCRKFVIHNWTQSEQDRTYSPKRCRAKFSFRIFFRIEPTHLILFFQLNRECRREWTAEFARIHLNFPIKFRSFVARIDRRRYVNELWIDFFSNFRFVKDFGEMWLKLKCLLLDLRWKKERIIPTQRIDLIHWE